jgi:hypothetical protein
MKTVYVCHSTHFDFKNELYGPLREGLGGLVNLILPHENSDEQFDSKTLFSRNDDLVVLVLFNGRASTGKDKETGMAYQVDVPMVGIYRKGLVLKPSEKVGVVHEIEYESIENIVEPFKKWLGL